MIDHGSQSPDQDARASMPEACRADALPVILDHGGRKAAGEGGAKGTPRIQKGIIGRRSSPDIRQSFRICPVFCRRYFSRLN